MNDFNNISNNEIEENISHPVSGVEVLGTSQDEFGKRLIVAKSCGTEDNDVFAFDPVNLITGSSRDLAKILVNQGVISPLSKNLLEIQKDIAYQYELKKKITSFFLKTPALIIA